MGLVIEDFSKGWQNKARRELMNDSALYVCTDIGLERLGALVARRMHKEQAYFDTQTITSAIEDVYFVYVEGVERYLIYYRIGGVLYCWDSATTTTRTVSSSMSGAVVSYAPLKPILSDSTYIYITDGVTMLCDNGTTTKTWGIDSPTGLPVVEMAGSGGSLSAGDYVYAYTFYDGDTGSESDPSVLSATTTAVADDSATITNITVSASSRVTKRRLYRTLVDGGTKYLVEPVNNNTVTEYSDDSTPDEDLTTELNTDQGVPETGDVVVAYKERLFLSGDSNFPNRVYFSRAERPDNWPSTYYLDVGTSNDKIMSMVEFEGKLYFLQRAGIVGLYGSDSDTFAWHKTRSHVGVKARWTAAAGPDGIYFVSHDGVYRFDGLKSVNVSEPIDRTFGLVADSWTEIVDQDIVATNGRGCFLGQKYYLSLPLKDISGTVTQRLLSYDTVDQTWQLYLADLDALHADPGRGKLYGSMERPDDSGKYSVYELLSVATSSVDSSTPKFVTKSFPAPGTTTDGKGQAVGWLRRFRVDCKGTWTLYFYVDGTLQHTEALTGQSESTRYKWYDFGPQTKGRYFFVYGVAGDDAEPGSTVFNSLEVE